MGGQSRARTLVPGSRGCEIRDFRVTPSASPYHGNVTNPLDTVFGLPTHSLVVHAVVVLLPLAALGAIAVVLRRSWVHRLGLATTIIGAVAVAASWVSRFSGSQLASRVGYPDPHHDYGQVLPVIATVFFVLWTIYWLFARGVPRNRTRPWWLLVLGGLVVLASAVLVWFTILTGHSGSASVWEAIIENTSPGQFVEP